MSKKIRIGIWIILGLSFLTGFFLQPGPAPDELGMHYILYGSVNWGEAIAAAIMSICVVVLLIEAKTRNML